MQRRKVDLPEPDGPTRQKTSRGRDLQVDALEDVDGAEGLVDALGLHHGGHARSRSRPPDGWNSDSMFALTCCNGVGGSCGSEPRA